MNKSTFIPYSKQTISENDIKRVCEVLRSPLITQGPKVEEFEKNISKEVNSKYSVAVNSATSALHIACLALKLKKTDILWTTPITFVASANCGRYCGAKIDFVDIEQKTGLMSIRSLEEKLIYAEKNGTLPKIVIPVHLAGSSCDMNKIWKLSKKYNFKVIEDASHAIGGSYRNEPVGCCKFSDICIFSFHPVKIITTGEGGVATTNSQELEIKMKRLRSHGITKDKNKFKSLQANEWVYEQQELGFNYRMSDIHASLGLSQLERLKEIVKERNIQYKIYERLLANSKMSMIDIPKDVYSALHLGIIRLNLSDKKKYKIIFEKMRENGIGVQLHYIPVHLQPYYQELGFSKGMYKNSEDYATNSLSIPLYPGLSEEEQNMVIKLLEEIRV